MPTSDRPAIKHQHPPPSPEPRGKRNYKRLPSERPPTQYEYKFIPYFSANAEDLFNELGISGWRFVGHAAHGPAIFQRERKDEI